MRSQCPGSLDSAQGRILKSKNSLEITYTIQHMGPSSQLVSKVRHTKLGQRGKDFVFGTPNDSQSCLRKLTLNGLPTIHGAGLDSPSEPVRPGRGRIERMNKVFDARTV